MKILPIDEFGKFLILRKATISKEDFCKKMKCNFFSNSPQECLYTLFCLSGEQIDPLFKEYLHAYPDSKFDLKDFLCFFYKLDKENVESFLKDKKENEFVYFTDNVLIYGYKEIFLFREDYDNGFEILEFRKDFMEAIKYL